MKNPEEEPAIVLPAVVVPSSTNNYVYFDVDSSGLKSDSFSDGILRCKGCNYILSAEHITACRYCMGDLNTRNKKLRGALNELEDEVFRLQRDLNFLRTWDEELINNTSGTGDITLRASDGNFFRAHRFVLASKSPVFRKLMHEEKTMSVLTVVDMVPEVLGPFLEYLYTAQVSCKTLEKHAADLLAAAHGYGIASLKSVCEEYLCHQVQQENAVVMIELAYKYDSAAIKEAAYDSVVTTYKDMLACPDFKAFLEREPRIAADMLKELLMRTSTS